MTAVAGIFAGQDYKTARNNIVELLKAKWNLVKIEDYTWKVGYGERTWAKIETLISTQWFINIEPLAKKVIKWYKNKDFEIIPQRFTKTFEDWILIWEIGVFLDNFIGDIEFQFGIDQMKKYFVLKMKI